MSRCKWAQVINTAVKDSLERDSGVLNINVKPSQSDCSCQKQSKTKINNNEKNQNNNKNNYCQLKHRLHRQLTSTVFLLDSIRSLQFGFVRLPQRGLEGMPNYVEEGSRVFNIRKIALDQEFMSQGHRFTKSTKKLCDAPNHKNG